MTTQESYWEKRADAYMSDPWAEYIKTDKVYAAWLKSASVINGCMNDGSDIDEEGF